MAKKHCPAQVIHKQLGSTMIELMITLVVVSIGLLSIAALQIKTTQFSQASLQRSISIVQASDLVERLWAGACDLSDKRNTIISEWSADHGSLPDGWDDLNIVEGNGELQVTITIPLLDRLDDSQDVSIVHVTTLPMLSCS